MGSGANMAIVCPNSDESGTLSYTMAPAEVIPTVVSAPPRVAKLDIGLSDVYGDRLTISLSRNSPPPQSAPNRSSSTPSPPSPYCLPSPSIQPVIGAFASALPSSASPYATLIQHADLSTFTLDLTLPITSNDLTSGAEHKRHMMTVDHGFLCTVSFFGLLLLGVLIARWARMSTAHWFVGHAVTRVDANNIYFYAAGLYIIVGADGSGESIILKLISLRWEDLRATISVPFQDYAHFPIEENIGLGDTDNCYDEDKIFEAARLGGAEEYVEQLPEGFDTYLDRPFRGHYSFRTGGGCGTSPKMLGIS
ncbi:hypothetical protein FIBSPDRAFT_959001 [Athelia psychrophila]|uniref:Uncharacterized protein n=1 Tax=Athelia psychrophila TaxID=1759441 RepID=A0A166DXZ0_9AGAM|nr:hypothetical protein FIBSPDRAFT_959001 [Fibularhizoctonia sp. CBS 109695]